MHPRHHFRRRFSALLAAPLAASALVSCSTSDVLDAASPVIDAFGPRPDSVVLTLAQEAAADAAHGDDKLSTIRGHHADDLFNEIARLCGTDDSGEVPQTCAVERTPGDATSAGTPEAVTADALGLHLDAADRVPEGSVDMVVSQAVDIAATDAELPEPVELLVEEDADLARGLLEREYAAVYGLDLARAFVDPAQAEATDALISAHEQRQLALTELLEPTGNVPAAAPGYLLDGIEQPRDAASAAAFIEDLEVGLDTAWRDAATHVADETARSWFVAAAGHGAAAAESYRDELAALS